MQQCSSDSNNNTNNKYYCALKKYKRYAMIKAVLNEFDRINFYYSSHEEGSPPSVQFQLFKTVNSGLFVNDTEILKSEQNVYFGQISFESTTDIKVKLKKLLRRRDIVAATAQVDDGGRHLIFL
jgi:hypothetical protein